MKYEWIIVQKSLRRGYHVGKAIKPKWYTDFLDNFDLDYDE